MVLAPTGSAPRDNMKQSCCIVHAPLSSFPMGELTFAAVAVFPMLEQASSRVLHRRNRVALSTKLPIRVQPPAGLSPSNLNGRTCFEEPSSIHTWRSGVQTGCPEARNLSRRGSAALIASRGGQAREASIRLLPLRPTKSILLTALNE